MNGLGAGAYGLLGAAPFVLQTNRYGERYTDESFIGMWGTCHQGIRQPKGLLATVWDAKWRTSLETQALEHGNVDIGDNKKLADLEEAMSKALAAGAEGYPPASAGDRVDGEDREESPMLHRRSKSWQGILATRASLLKPLLQLSSGIMSFAKRDMTRISERPPRR